MSNLNELADKLGAKIRTAEEGDALVEMRDSADSWYRPEQVNPKNPGAIYGTKFGSSLSPHANS